MRPRAPRARAASGSGSIDRAPAPLPYQLESYDERFWSTVGPNLAWLNVQWYANPRLVDEYYAFVSGETTGTAVPASRVVVGATVEAQGQLGNIPLCDLMKIVVSIQGKPGCSSFGGVSGWEFTQTIDAFNPETRNWDTCIAAALLHSYGPSSPGVGIVRGACSR